MTKRKTVCCFIMTCLYTLVIMTELMLLIIPYTCINFEVCTYQFVGLKCFLFITQFNSSQLAKMNEYIPYMCLL